MIQPTSFWSTPLNAKLKISYILIDKQYVLPTFKSTSLIFWTNILLFFRSIVSLASLSFMMWLSCTQQGFQIRFPSGHLHWKQIPHPLWEFHDVIGSCHYINEIRAILSISCESWAVFSSLFFYYNSKIKVSKGL